MNRYILIILALVPLSLGGQGLFESAGQAEADNPVPFTLGGFSRGVVYLGENSAPLSSQVRSSYGELALKLNASSGGRASFYSEFRIRSGFEYNRWITETDLLEAYADIDLDRFNLRVGQQIIVWGRADGINPTHNITPRNYFARSPDPDDMNNGNFAVRTRFNLLDQIRLEAIWVPVYKYSIYRFDLFNTPGYVTFSQSQLPEAKLDNGSFAVRMEFLFQGFDGSLSWFNGYDPMPGIQAGELPENLNENFTINMFSRAFRQQTLGLDFSCGMGSFGVRGEAALRIPASEYKDAIYTPRQDLRYVLGIDRMFGDLNIMIMYLGQYVFDYVESMVPGGLPEIDPLQLQDPLAWAMLGPMMDEQLKGFNRIIFSQTEKVSHSLAFRPSLSLFHEVAEAEIFGLYNFSTEEWHIYPKLTWRVTDDLKLSLGGQYYKGPGNSMYDMISPVFNGGFLELRYTF